jgi:NAD(P)-dependent dehydrogenase (short-subunit alcohol dehydrogenase family)
MKDVKGKVAVITGAASGIGRGMAESFIDAGMKVVLSDVEQNVLETTTQSLLDVGADVHAVVTDVTKPDQISKLADEALRKFGAVHVLCNNAGIALDLNPSWAATMDDWNWIMNVNLMGVIFGIKTFLPIMIEQDTEAHIVNTASTGGLIYGINTLYAVTKFGVVALSEGTYLELLLAGLKPRISVLCPSFVDTHIVNSGRNRPIDLGKTAINPNDPAVKNLQQWWGDLVKKRGISPRSVGDRGLAAIQDEHFYILTHPDENHLIGKRMNTILTGENPTFPALPEFLSKKIRQSGRK